MTAIHRLPISGLAFTLRLRERGRLPKAWLIPGDGTQAGFSWHDRTGRLLRGADDGAGVIVFCCGGSGKNRPRNPGAMTAGQRAEALAQEDE